MNTRKNSRPEGRLFFALKGLFGKKFQARGSSNQKVEPLSGVERTP